MPEGVQFSGRIDRFPVERQSPPEPRQLPTLYGHFSAEELVAAVQTIAELMQPYDGGLEDFDTWLRPRATQYVMRDQTLL